MTAAFIDSASSRETSGEIMEAIDAIARSESEAVRIWEAPSYEEALAIWERVTRNGNRDSSEYQWGAAGGGWAAEFGLDG